MVNVLGSTNRSFGCHDLSAKLLFALDKLIQIRIKGFLCDVSVDMYFGILVTLSDDSAGSLLQIRRSPRAVEVMQGNQLVLSVGACAHLCGRAKQHSDLALPDLAEQVEFLRFGLCVMDKGDLIFGDSSVDQLLADVRVDGKLALTFRGGQVTKQKLC